MMRTPGTAGIGRTTYLPCWRCGESQAADSEHEARGCADRHAFRGRKKQPDGLSGLIAQSWTPLPVSAHDLPLPLAAPVNSTSAAL
jgi:hypothetical protein